MERKKLLFYGGSFDPPHRGHEKLLESAIAAVRPDLTLVIPTGVAPHKSRTRTAFWTRFEMCSCFKKYGDNVKISSIEYTGKKGSHRCYTSETVKRLRKKYPGYDLYMLIGSDMVASFHRWHLYRRVMAKCVLVAGCRDDDMERPYLEAAAALEKEGAKIMLLDFTPVEVSSTELRKKLKDGEDAPELISPETRAVIDRKGLYR